MNLPDAPLNEHGLPLAGLVDVNCYVGEWPFRRVPCNTVNRLLSRMDLLEIDRAAVSRLENVFFKDCLVGNRELATLIALHSDRFSPFYTFNPAFPGWEDELTICARELSLAPDHGGLRLHPNYHGYALDGPEAAALLVRAQTERLVVSVAARLEDERTHHWLCKVPAVPPSALAAAIAAFPAIRWIVCGLRAREIVALHRDLASRGLAGEVGEAGVAGHAGQAPPTGRSPQADQVEVLYDLSLVQGPIDECALLAEMVGVERLAFGTNLPLTVPEAPWLALQHAGLSDDDKRPIAAGNARRLLG